MLHVSSIDPAFLPCFLAAIALGALAWGLGWALIPGGGAGEEPLTTAAARLVSGLLFISGVAATLCLRRFCFVTALLVLQAGFAIWAWRTRPPAAQTAPRGLPSLVLAMAAVALGCAAFEWWNMGWVTGNDGAVRGLHSDLGYFAQLAKGLPEARAASLWAAVLGPEATTGSATRDVWYHWGPIWLSLAVTSATGIPAIVALLQVSAMVLDFVLVIAAGAIVGKLTGWAAGRSLLVGAASLVAVQLMRLFGVQWLGDWLPFGIVQHTRMSLAYCFSYKFEGAVVLAAMAAWQSKRMPLAVFLLFCASVSAPHNVAMGGVTAGVMGGLGLLLRQPRLWKTAGVIIATLLSAWAMLHFGFGVDLPKAGDQALLVLDFNTLRLGLRAGVIDSLVALLLGALSLPGIVFLIRGKDPLASEESRLLGWLALSGVAGGYIAFHLLSTVTDRFHFTLLTHSILVMPAGVWGLARMASVYKGLARGACIALIVLGTGMGAADLQWFRQHENPQPWKAADLKAVQKVLAGRPFGYVSTSDRPWWISKQGSLASMLDSRCVRIDEIPGIDRTSSQSRYYGASRPYELLPLLPEEKAEAWSLRFARRLGVVCLLEIAPETLPPAFKTRARELLSVTGLKLYELNPP